MPEEFDPSWEYFEPNQEILEVMNCGRLGDFDDLGLEGEYKESIRYYRKNNANFGFRFGCKNPDKLIIDPEPLPPTIGTLREEKQVKRLMCGWCTRLFIVTRTRKNFCNICCPSSGKPLIPFMVCTQCLKEFKPTHRRYSRFCSRKCAAVYNLTKVEFKDGCPICGGKVIKSGKGRSFTKIYCSKKCQHRAVQRRSYRSSRNK